MRRAGAVAARRELDRPGDPEMALPGTAEAGSGRGLRVLARRVACPRRDEASRAEAEMSNGNSASACAPTSASRPGRRTTSLPICLEPCRPRNAIAPPPSSAPPKPRTRPSAQGKAQLEREAVEARALADLLDRKPRSWSAPTISEHSGTPTPPRRAPPNNAPHRTRRPLHRRRCRRDTTTAEQFLADQRAGLAEDDRHREITAEQSSPMLPSSATPSCVRSNLSRRRRPQKPACQTSATSPPVNHDGRLRPRTTGPAYRRRTRPPTASPARSVRLPNSSSDATSSSDAPTKKPGTANSPTGTTPTRHDQGGRAQRRPSAGPDLTWTQLAAACEISNGGRRDPCHVHSSVAATPRARSGGTRVVKPPRGIRHRSFPASPRAVEA